MTSGKVMVMSEERVVDQRKFRANQIVGEVNTEEMLSQAVTIDGQVP